MLSERVAFTVIVPGVTPEYDSYGNITNVFDYYQPLSRWAYVTSQEAGEDDNPDAKFVAGQLVFTIRRDDDTKQIKVGDTLEYLGGAYEVKAVTVRRVQGLLDVVAGRLDVD